MATHLSAAIMIQRKKEGYRLYATQERALPVFFHTLCRGFCIETSSPRMCCWRQMALCGYVTLGWQWTSHVRARRVVWALWTTCLLRQEVFSLQTCLLHAFPL